jgi:uncharacterized membrane protein
MTIINFFIILKSFFIISSHFIAIILSKRGEMTIMMFLPLVVLFIFLYLNSSKYKNNLNFVRATHSNNALNILNRQFTNGEISEDEYLRMRSLLK